jgi:hypothetical protein
MPAEGRPLPFLNVLVSLVVMIAALYWAKAVVIPVALAILMTAIRRAMRSSCALLPCPSPTWSPRWRRPPVAPLYRGGRSWGRGPHAVSLQAAVRLVP